MVSHCSSLQGREGPITIIEERETKEKCRAVRVSIVAKLEVAEYPMEDEDVRFRK